MLPRGVSARFAVTFGALFVVTLGLLVALVVYLASGWLESALDDHLRSVATDVATRMEDPDADRTLLVERFSSPTQLIEVRDAEGVVVARSSLLDDQTLPVSRAALAAQQERYATAPYERGRLRVLVYPVVMEDDVTGYVTVATPVPGLGRQVRELVLIIVLIGSAALGLSLVATWLVANWLTRPLRELAAAVRRNATAEVPEEITVRPPGSAEVMEVARAVSVLTEEQRLRLERERSFFADSSHVLRTPLAVLQGNLELLEQARDDADRNDAIAQSQAALQSINRTVRGLLLLSRERAGVGDWRLVDLSALVHSVAGEFRRAWPQHTLTCDIEPGIEVAVDEHQMREALEAVVENAGRYTPSGGTVEIRCRSVGDRAVVEVLDSGIGLSEEEARRATERFFRGFEARALQPGGSGLGLAIARRILTMHGGTLVIAPREHVEGAHVTIELPLLDGPAD